MRLEGVQQIGDKTILYLGELLFNICHPQLLAVGCDMVSCKFSTLPVRDCRRVWTDLEDSNCCSNAAKSL